MKILITGGMGFIGSNLIDLLLQEKHNIIVLTKSYSKKKNISHIQAKIKVEKVDITNHRKLSNIIEQYKPEMIIHLAGETSHSKSFENPLKDIDSNAKSTLFLLEKIRGQEYDVRHILLRPKVTLQDINEAKEKLELTRKRIVDGEISFADAAREVSDEDETKFEGGLLINPETQDYVFPLTKMDPELYSQIQNLKDKEVSLVLTDEDRINKVKFKILTVTNRVDEHEANFANDYIKIKELTLREKQIKAGSRAKKILLIESMNPDWVDLFDTLE